jgi:hypothetical protein
MKKIITIALAITMLMAVPSLASAQEAAKYNFATAQGDKQIQVIPGKEGKGVIYFYNIDGNRITHVTLEISQTPSNWEVKIDPPLHETKVEIGGQVVTVTENLYVEPSELLSQPATDVPSGMVSITVPGRGYTLAKVANIIVRVPETETIGKKADLKISGTAEWLGQTGAAAIKQTRDFDFSVQVISGSTNTEEKIIGEGSTEPTPPEEKPEGKTTLPGWLLAVAIAAIAIIALIAILVVLTRRRQYY